MLRQTLKSQHIYMLTFVHKYIDKYRTCIDKCQHIYTEKRYYCKKSKLVEDSGLCCPMNGKSSLATYQR